MGAPLLFFNPMPPNSLSLSSASCGGVKLLGATWRTLRRTHGKSKEAREVGMGGGGDWKRWETLGVTTNCSHFNVFPPEGSEGPFAFGTLGRFKSH